MKHSRKLSLGRLSAYVGLGLGAVLLALLSLILTFGGAILNGYGRGKVERAFTKAHFAAHDFRTTRFHVVAPECSVLGLAYGELLQRKSYRARSIHFSRPSFEALVKRDKPPEPFVKRPLMLHEALAAIRQPLQVDSLSITNGHLTYCERVACWESMKQGMPLLYTKVADD